LPKPAQDIPELFGVNPSYADIHNWRFAEGRPFTQMEDKSASAVCVMGEAAKISMLGFGPAVNGFVKVDQSWLRVVGVLKAQVSSGAGGLAPDLNNIIYIPLNTFQYRFETGESLKDDLAGVDMRLKPGSDSSASAKVVSAILNSTHHNIADYAVTIPAELLAEPSPPFHCWWAASES
jgi:putative ABC transport system permease protein